MQKKWSPKVIILFSIIFSLFLTAAIPTPFQSALAGINEKQSQLRLTVENKTTNYLYLKLDGDVDYWFSVKAKDEEIFAVNRGVYNLTVYACGSYGKMSLDMRSKKTLIMPVCGGNAKTAAKGAGVVDLSTLIKIVKVSFTNKALTDMLVILTGRSTYVFTLKKGKTYSYTIAKGHYTLEYWACSRSAIRSYNASKGKTLTLTCP